LSDIFTHVDSGLDPLSTNSVLSVNTVSEVENGVTTLKSSEHVTSFTHSDGAELEVSIGVALVVGHISGGISTLWQVRSESVSPE
jgi:hypothetical protein